MQVIWVMKIIGVFYESLKITQNVLITKNKDIFTSFL